MIDFANLQIQYQKYKKSIDLNIAKVLDHSSYIMGEDISTLEDHLAEYTGIKNVITCSSGTDALLIALMAIGTKPGDEIITTPFSFISTAEVIALLGATPVFVDIEFDSFNIDVSLIENAISSKTKAIIPVGLYGQPADLSEINELAIKYNLKVINDGAQSFGSVYKGSSEAEFVDISTTSFFPSKPFGCYGDGGALFTNNDDYAELARMIRVHGQVKRYHHQYLGIGGRLDTIQAAILLAKLPYYQDELNTRNKLAERYNKGLSEKFIIPRIKSNRSSSWAQYTIRVKERDKLVEYLKSKGIPSAVHYPIPLHLQPCFSYLNYKLGSFEVSEKASQEVLSLPMNAFISSEELDFICKVLTS